MRLTKWYDRMLGLLDKHDIYDNIMQLKIFTHYWPFVSGIYWSRVDFRYNGQYSDIDGIFFVSMNKFFEKGRFIMDIKLLGQDTVKSTYQVDIYIYVFMKELDLEIKIATNSLNWIWWQRFTNTWVFQQQTYIPAEMINCDRPWYVNWISNYPISLWLRWITYKRD